MGRRMKVPDMSTAKWQQAYNDAAMKKTILEGIERTQDGVKQKMDPYKDLKPEQIDALIKFIRSSGPKEPL
jgi:hypothetical protein